MNKKVLKFGVLYSLIQSITDGNANLNNNFILTDDNIAMVVGVNPQQSEPRSISDIMRMMQAQPKSLLIGITDEAKDLFGVNEINYKDIKVKDIEHLLDKVDIISQETDDLFKLMLHYEQE